MVEPLVGVRGLCPWSWKLFVYFHTKKGPKVKYLKKKTPIFSPWGATARSAHIRIHQCLHWRQHFNSFHFCPTLYNVININKLLSVPMGEPMEIVAARKLPEDPSMWSGSASRVNRQSDKDDWRYYTNSNYMSNFNWLYFIWHNTFCWPLPLHNSKCDYKHNFVTTARARVRWMGGKGGIYVHRLLRQMTAFIGVCSSQQRTEKYRLNCWHWLHDNSASLLMST